MTQRIIRVHTIAEALYKAAEFGGNATHELQASGVLIIGSDGEEHRPEPRMNENEGRPRRPLIYESPELQLEIVPTDDPNECRLRDLRRQGAITGF
ncbi:MAG: hypothetical protein ABID64_03825 [Nitrospirota bacterium]